MGWGSWRVDHLASSGKELRNYNCPRVGHAACQSQVGSEDPERTQRGLGTGAPCLEQHDAAAAPDPCLFHGKLECQLSGFDK